MSKFTKKLVYLIGNTFGWLFTLVVSYLISFIATGSLMSMYCCVASFINGVPEIIYSQYGKMLFLFSLPLAVVIFLYMVVYAVKNRKTKGSKKASPDTAK